MKIAKQWYTVNTKPRNEQKVAELLSKKNIENYCPLNKITPRWSLRKKFTFEALFTSFVFIYATEAEHQAVKETEGVLNFIYWLGRPAIINDFEVDTIKNCLGEYSSLQLEQIDVDINEPVSIDRGPFYGLDGNSQEQTNVVKFNLPSLGFALVAIVKQAHVEVITANEAFSHKMSTGFQLRRAV